MTTTVTVKARAHGAVVATNGETIEIGPNQERQFHIEEGTQSFEVTQPEAPLQQDRASELATEEVPGRAENDKLVSPVAPTVPEEESAQTAEAPRRGR